MKSVMFSTLIFHWNFGLYNMYILMKCVHCAQSHEIANETVLVCSKIVVLVSARFCPPVTANSYVFVYASPGRISEIRDERERKNSREVTTLHTIHAHNVTGP